MCVYFRANWRAAGEHNWADKEVNDGPSVELLRARVWFLSSDHRHLTNHQVSSLSRVYLDCTSHSLGLCLNGFHFCSYLRLRCTALVTLPWYGGCGVLLLACLYVSLFVCLFVCLIMLKHISRTTCPNFTKFSAHIAYGCRSILFWQRFNMSCTAVFSRWCCVVL